SPASINLGREGFRRAHAWTGWIILAAAIATARTDLIARLRSSADAAHRRSFFFDQWRARLKSSARLRNPVPALIENFIDPHAIAAEAILNGLDQRIVTIIEDMILRANFSDEQLNRMQDEKYRKAGLPTLDELKDELGRNRKAKNGANHEGACTRTR